MKREKLLKSKAYWLTQIQNELFGVIEKYISKKQLNRTGLADELRVTKGYVTQIMNGDFDHKISKMVELSLACDSVPLIYFVDKEQFIKADSEDKIYEIMPMPRPRRIDFSESPSDIKSTDYTRITNSIMDKLPILNDVSGNEFKVENIPGDKPMYEMYQPYC